MEKKSVGLSIRYKLLILLTILPIAVLSLYLLMATSLFEKDKIAYVYESSVSVAASLGTQVKLEVETFLDRVRPIVSQFDIVQGEFSPVGKDLFQKQDRIHVLLLYQHSPSGEYVKLGHLERASGFESVFLSDVKLLRETRTKAVQDDVSIQAFHATGKHLVIAHRIGPKDQANHKILVALLEADDLLDAFGKSALYKSVLLDPRGTVAIDSGSLADIGVRPEDHVKFFEPILKSELPKGTVEITTQSGNRVLVSYTDPRIGGMILASVVDRKAALEAVEVLVTKSILFFIALISTTVIISVFASFSLTSTLRELYEATRKIANGQFDVRVTARSSDEVGGLAESFNWMAGEVSRLLTETAHKARMENELATVKTVQETLFPPNRSQFGPLRIVGHFEPASECGGDWWNYSRIGDKIYLWIGDATGHGAPAALITSAAKSASSIIEMLPEMGPGRALEIMNNAIHETSKGQIMMTFFLATIDLNTGKMVYANASHDPPYLIRPTDRPISKKDLMPLMDVNGSRLGDKKGSTYQEATVDLQKNDVILFYTDGVIDVQDPSGKSWGERQFLKSVVHAAGSGASVEDKMEALRAQIREFRESSELIDDITLFMCHYGDAA